MLSKRKRPADLDLTRRMLRRRNLSKIGGNNAAVGIRELRMVPGVKELASDHEAHGFVNRKSLVDAHIPVVQPGASQDIETGSAKRPGGTAGVMGIGRRVHKAGFVNPE